jgi:hypothetical protein
MQLTPDRMWQDHSARLFLQMMQSAEVRHKIDTDDSGGACCVAGRFLTDGYVLLHPGGVRREKTEDRCLRPAS